MYLHSKLVLQHLSTAYLLEPTVHSETQSTSDRLAALIWEPRCLRCASSRWPADDVSNPSRSNITSCSTGDAIHASMFTAAAADNETVDSRSFRAGSSGNTGNRRSDLEQLWQNWPRKQKLYCLNYTTLHSHQTQMCPIVFNLRFLPEDRQGVMCRENSWKISKAFGLFFVKIHQKQAKPFCCENQPETVSTTLMLNPNLLTPNRGSV